MSWFDPQVDIPEGKEKWQSSIILSDSELIGISILIQAVCTH